MKPILFILCILTTGLLACSKENKKYCWAIVDALGNQYGQECDKSEKEMAEKYSNSCSYYKEEDQKFCWMMNGNFIKNASEAQMEHARRCFAQPVATKVDCSYCEKLYSREKRTYKPNSTTSYTSVTFKTYCGTDLTAIPANKQITRKDDADSLIIIQFSVDGATW